jgi:hypothetical protein
MFQVDFTVVVLGIEEISMELNVKVFPSLLSPSGCT